MRPKRIIPIVLFVLLMITLPLLLVQQFSPVFSPARPLMNRFQIDSMGVSFIQLDSLDRKRCGAVSLLDVPFQVDATIGIEIRIDMTFVTDSTRVESFLLTVPGQDGAMNALTSIDWVDAGDPQMKPIQMSPYRATELTCVEYAISPASKRYASRPAVNIPNLDSIAAWLNTGRNVPSTLEGKIAFYIWPDSADLVRLATSQAQLRMTFQSGKTLVAALPQSMPPKEEAARNPISPQYP